MAMYTKRKSSNILKNQVFALFKQVNQYFELFEQSWIQRYATITISFSSVQRALGKKIAPYHNYQPMESIVSVLAKKKFCHHIN